MTVELMTTAVCWDSEENVSAKFAHHYSKGFFYFCPECFVRVVGAKSILDNFFFKAPQSHLQRCINAKASSTNANASGTSTPRPAYVPPPFIPSHLGMYKLKRKGTKPTDIQMQSLVSKVKVKPVV